MRIRRAANQKRAARHASERDLTQRVRRAVSARLVKDEVAGCSGEGAAVDDEAASATIVDAAASRAVELVRQHRKSLQTGRGLVSALVQQLTETTQERRAFAAAIEAETADDADKAPSGSSFGSGG